MTKLGQGVEVRAHYPMTFFKEKITKCLHVCNKMLLRSIVEPNTMYSDSNFENVTRRKVSIKTKTDTFQK